MSGYDIMLIFSKYQDVWIAYLAVLCSEGYSIFDMTYYSCLGYGIIMSVYVILITF